MVADAPAGRLLRHAVSGSNAAASLSSKADTALEHSLMGASIQSGITVRLQDEFHVGREVVTLGVSLYLLGFVFGPMIWGPMSELRGRVQVNVISCVLFIGMNVGCALSRNIQSFIIFRLFVDLMLLEHLTEADPPVVATVSQASWPHPPRRTCPPWSLICGRPTSVSFPNSATAAPPFVRPSWDRSSVATSTSSVGPTLGGGAFGSRFLRECLCPRNLFSVPC